MFPYSNGCGPVIQRSKVAEGLGGRNFRDVRGVSVPFLFADGNDAAPRGQRRRAVTHDCLILMGH
jgi:hypothetical protein